MKSFLSAAPQNEWLWKAIGNNNPFWWSADDKFLTIRRKLGGGSQNLLPKSVWNRRRAAVLSFAGWRDSRLRNAGDSEAFDGGGWKMSPA